MKREATSNAKTAETESSAGSGCVTAKMGGAQRRLLLLITALLCALLLFWPPPVVLAQSTVTVTNANDTGAGSLRQAITDATAGSTIVFDSSLSGATIRLASELTLSKNVTIDGSALATQITINGDTNNDSTGDVRAFTVNAGVVAVLKNLTVTKGNALSYGTPYGGAIYNDGDLTIINSTFSANKGNYAGAIGNWGTLTVRGTTFSSNQANHQGGAIMNFGTLNMANSTIAGNSAGSYGGGISNVEKGATTLTNVTIWQNAANVSNLADSTGTSGGGIYVSGIATAYPSTLAYANTIIAGSTKGNDCEIRLALSTLSVNQSNYVGDAGCTATYSGNPNLAALANNGGPTLTAAPNIGSPVINMGNDTVCANVGSVDQRGVARPWGSHCDIGAVEYTQAVAPIAGRNGALTFDGSNDIVDLGNVAALNGVSRYTLEGWVRFSAFSNNATVLAKRQSDGDRAAMIQLYDSQGQVAVAVNGGYGYSSNKVELNKWVHLAAVFDGTKASDADRLKLYIDGVPATLTFLNSVPATTPTSATRLTLGAEYNGTAPVSSISSLRMPMTGQLDEIRLWNVARSQAEIQAAMYNRMNVGESGLVGYWPLDEGSGNTTADKSGSQTGVLIGGPGWINSSLLLRPGLDLTFATQANIPVTNTLVGIAPDGGAVNYSVAVVPSHGAVQITGAQSGAFIYTPATDYVGADAFVYQVADSGGLTDTATVTVTMSPASTGAIEGVVFDDLNGNGVKDVGEAGVAGVTVSRSGGPDTSTAGDGTYRFGDVPVGSYTVSINVPTGYVASGSTSRTVSVASGGAAKANFALQAQGVIQGVVYEDLNGNKEQDLGEPGVAGVTISRADGPNTTTGDDGTYRFSSVSPGSYTLVLSVPAGYVAVGPTSSTVNFASGSSARANFILQTQGVIQGVVFDDLNGNGAQDSGEPGVAGVAITRDDGPDTTTGVDGSYRFTDVVPGGYVLFVTVPAGYVSIGQTNRMVDVVNGSSAQANFALQAQGVIQGMVFEDRNGNGEQDSGEPGVGGVTINRDDGPNTTTGDDGSYRFSNVNAGAYTLFVSVPSGFFPVGQTSRTVNVASGGSAQANFSLQAQGAIQGVVYEDLNGNGRQDSGESGIGGVTVSRSDGPGTTTSLDGTFRFSNVSVGSYTLSIGVPAGYVAVGRTSRTVSVASGGAAQANFSLQAQGVIQGLVFDDRNGNGVQDSGESGINGVTIARGDGPTAATGLDGTYRFTDVVPGIYALAITVPDGYVAVGQTSRTVNVPSGGSVRSNFILQARGVIQGVVFDDFNGNGVQDGGEAGVGGVVVSRSSGVTTTTSLDGAYRFSNVSPGSYTLSIAVPAGYVPSGQTSSTVNVAIGGSVQANFALQVQGVLGVVFDDLNGNNKQDGGEPGLGGVSITLEGGPTVITSLDGKYRFRNVAPDSYFLFLDLPAGYVSVGPTNRTVTVAADGSARANFALQAQSVIQGVVFDDLNGNGAQDVGEAGVGGVTITRDDGPNTTTSSDGSYLFTSVVPGGYTLFLGVPAGYISVGQTNRVVNVASGGSAQANFAVQAQGVIQGVVFDDRNGNNEQDTGEPGIGGVVVSQSSGVTTTTSGDGGYRFSNINPGSYTLAISVPAGFVATGQTSRTVNVGSGGSAQANFSLQAQGAIQGVVFDDLNGNGRQDAGEPGVGGVPIGRGAGQQTTTGGDGSYRFSNVTVGSYTLVVDVPAGYVAVGRTSRTVSVAAGGAAQANFSLQAQGIIQGLVFDDRNGNGVQDSGETGIGGIAITRGDGPVAATSLDGTYRFTDVVPGAYALAITVPDSYVAVGQTSRTVYVGSGGSVQSNFILQARGVIQGVVFDDFNGNDVQDSGEAGVGGVVVSQSTGVTATTSLDGSYRFSNVAPGSYNLSVAVPAGYVASGQTTSTVNVAIGGSVQANFALQVQGVLGVVFDDLNGNNMQDGGEPGLGGVSITLEDGPTIATSLDGKYRFSNVVAGSYFLFLDLPAGYVSVGPTNRMVTVATGGSARANFALQAQSVLQGVVFDDLNGNGAQDVGEAGVGGVTINRDDGPNTTTNGDGSYLFTSVVPGGYTLFLGVPTGYVPVGLTSSVVNVASGGSAQANFALQAQGVIQGVVFDDRNGNNEQDSGEPGVGGVVISQSSGVTTTTSLGGGYRFSNVNPGSYTVGIAVPAHIVARGRTSHTVSVGSGGSAQANFALQVQGVIQGVVFDDRNGNGRQDAGELGVGGVAVSRGSGWPHTVTASDGSYRFSNVTVGSYTVSILLPPGHVAHGHIARTVSVASGGAAQANFALQAQGIIQGLVFDDRNGNGVQDNGETGVGGVTIARGDGPTTDTSLDGTYHFTNVVPGPYLLAISVPDSFVAVGQTSRTVNVGSGGSVQSNFILQARGVIQGVVFDDFNGNGVQDADESGVGGITVSRDGTDTTTASDGSYRFGDVAPGSYTLSIAVPAGYVPSGQTSSTVNVAIGGAVQANFSVQVQGVLGVVFDDLNGNGVQDGGESGMGGVNITLEDGPIVATSLDGKYRFSNVTPGSYTLYLDLPAGYVAVGRTNRMVTVAAGGSARANFALQVQGVLQGVVFDDLNGNGAQDVGETGVGGVTINRDDGPNTTTSGDGSYSFTGVVPGGYTLFLSVPAGYVSVGQTSSTVNVASGGSAQANFSVQAQGVIQGVVFDDRNGNNEQDTGEPGVGGVVVSQSNGVTTTTSLGGGYRFSNVNPGSYTLDISVPAGFVATGQTSRMLNVGSGGSAQANFALQAQGVIQGMVFDDRSGNGRQDNGEPGVGGVTVTRSGGQQVTTAGDGSYRFNAVGVGSHTVTVTVPAGYLAYSRASRIVNVANGSAAQANFILQAQGVIQGVVFDDRNFNGVKDGSDPGIGGVNITRGDGPTAATSHDGSYIFTDVTPGRYTLSISVPAWYIAGGLTTRTLYVASGGSSPANFSLQANGAMGAVEGVVYEDSDGNGQQDFNEPGIGGGIITSPYGTVETGIDGTYRYANVPAGNYMLDVTLPTGYVASTLLTQPVGVLSEGSSGANFGLLIQSVIQGMVFADGNGNGAQDSGEAGVSGVTVKIFSQVTEQLVDQRATSVNGDYRSAALAAGQYRVEVETPVGYSIPTGSAAVLVDVGTASGAAANFALRLPNSISGALFVDQNDNTLRDAGEPGLADVTIQVHGGASTLNAVTASDGSYLFSDVPSGIYSVSVGSLAGTGYTLSGLADRLVNLPAGQNGISAVALFTALPDQSLNGVTQPGSDVGLTGGGLVQSSSAAVAVPSVRVNRLGIFQFLNVAPGTYNLVVTPPPGFTAPQQAIPVTFIGGGARIAKSATNLIANGTIRGTLFEDIDGNQNADSHEKGVGGVEVQLLSGSTLVQQITTSSNGSYQFNSVPNGVYHIIVAAAQFVQTAAVTATLTADLPGANLDLSLVRQGTISGRIYRSDIGPTAGVENIAVTLTGAAQQSTLADADGFFHFDGLPAGAHVVALSQLPDVFFPIGGSSQAVDLGTAATGNGVNFGLVLRSGVPTALDPADEPTMVTHLYLPTVANISNLITVLEAAGATPEAVDTPAADEATATPEEAIAAPEQAPAEEPAGEPLESTPEALPTEQAPVQQTSAEEPAASTPTPEAEQPVQSDAAPAGGSTETAEPAPDESSVELPLQLHLPLIAR